MASNQGNQGGRGKKLMTRRRERRDAADPRTKYDVFVTLETTLKKNKKFEGIAPIDNWNENTQVTVKLRCAKGHVFPKTIFLARTFKHKGVDVHFLGRCADCSCSGVLIKVNHLCPHDAFIPFNEGFKVAQFEPSGFALVSGSKQIKFEDAMVMKDAKDSETSLSFKLSDVKPTMVERLFHGKRVKYVHICDYGVAYVEENDA